MRREVEAWEREGELWEGRMRHRMAADAWKKEGEGAGG